MIADAAAGNRILVVVRSFQAGIVPPQLRTGFRIQCDHDIAGSAEIKTAINLQRRGFKVFFNAGPVSPNLLKARYIGGVDLVSRGKARSTSRVSIVTPIGRQLCRRAGLHGPRPVLDIALQRRNG